MHMSRWRNWTDDRNMYMYICISTCISISLCNMYMYIVHICLDGATGRTLEICICI